MFCIKIKFISKSLESAHEQFGLSMRLSNVTMISVQKVNKKKYNADAQKMIAGAPHEIYISTVNR
jgi:hypothetical protein